MSHGKLSGHFWDLGQDEDSGISLSSCLGHTYLPVSLTLMDQVLCSHF